jgi:hypothetical protein
MPEPTPRRIQRSRKKGWRMPLGAVYVGHPTKCGDPFYKLRPRADAAARFGRETAPRLAEMARRELRGKDLVCWCRLDQPCHADVLLEIANAKPRASRRGNINIDDLISRRVLRRAPPEVGRFIDAALRRSFRNRRAGRQ